MPWAGRDLKDHEAPTPRCRQGHQPPHLIPAQAAQGPIQPGLEHLQGWTGHQQPLWAAVPAPHHSQSKELPPDIQPKSSLLPLKTIPPCPAVIYPCKELIYTIPQCVRSTGNWILQDSGIAHTLVFFSNSLIFSGSENIG